MQGEVLTSMEPNRRSQAIMDICYQMGICWLPSKRKMARHKRVQVAVKYKNLIGMEILYGNIVDDYQHHDFRRCDNGNTIYLGWELLSEDYAASC